MTKGGGGSKISKNWWRLLWTAPKVNYSNNPDLFFLLKTKLRKTKSSNTIKNQIKIREHTAGGQFYDFLTRILYGSNHLLLFFWYFRLITNFLMNFWYVFVKFLKLLIRNLSGFYRCRWFDPIWDSYIINAFYIFIIWIIFLKIFSNNLCKKLGMLNNEQKHIMQFSSTSHNPSL